MKYSNKIDLEKEMENDATSKVRTIPFKNGKSIKKQEIKSLCSRHKITLIIVGVFVGITVIGVALYLALNRCKLLGNSCKNNKVNENNNESDQIKDKETELNIENNPNPGQGNDNSLINEEELKEVFKPVFKINSKVGTLTQTLIK
jgi:hypothetical protein